MLTEKIPRPGRGIFLCGTAEIEDIPVEEIKATLVVANKLQLIVERARRSFFFYLFVYIPLQEIMRGIIFFGKRKVHQFVDAIAHFQLMFQKFIEQFFSSCNR